MSFKIAIDNREFFSSLEGKMILIVNRTWENNGHPREVFFINKLETIETNSVHYNVFSITDNKNTIFIVGKWAVAQLIQEGMVKFYDPDWTESMEII